METPKPSINQNPMPEIRIVPSPVEALGQAKDRVVDLVQRSVKFWRSVVVNTNVPLCESSYYTREHFTDDPLATPDTPYHQPSITGWDSEGRYMSSEGEW